MAEDTTQYQTQLSAYNQATDRYINDLLDQAGGDRDAAIAILTREHEQALGTDNTARAKFLETVSDALEKRIGTIPYDYQVGTTRANEDLTRTTDITERNRKQALSRLSEDEKVWKDQFADTSKNERVNQQEALLKRGVLQGTRNDAQGIAGEEVRNLEKDLGTTLSAYERALSRNKQDINTNAQDTIDEATINNTRTLEDLKTEARRAAQGAEDTRSDSFTAAQRAYEKAKKELERQRELGKLDNQSYAAI